MELQVVSLGDVLTILGFMVALAVQVWGAHRWLSGQLEKRDDRLQAAIAAFNREARAVNDGMATVKAEVFARVSHQERELATLDERVKSLPDRKEMGEIMRASTAPLLAHMETILELVKSRAQR